jgi:hypothetical protein
MFQLAGDLPYAVHADHETRSTNGAAGSCVIARMHSTIALCGHIRRQTHCSQFALLSPHSTMQLYQLPPFDPSAETPLRFQFVEFVLQTLLYGKISGHRRHATLSDVILQERISSCSQSQLTFLSFASRAREARRSCSPFLPSPFSWPRYRMRIEPT